MESIYRRYQFNKNSKLNEKKQNSKSVALYSSGDSNQFRDIRIKESDSQEVKFLKEQLLEMTNKYKKLLFEYEKTNIEYSHEKHRMEEMEKKLQFVKDNQQLIRKLKDLYVKMKYSENTGRKLVEIRENSAQTWDGIFCEYCMETQNLRQELEEQIASIDNCILVNNDDISEMDKTIETLKSVLQQSEE